MGTGPEQISLKRRRQMTKQTWKGAQHPPVLRGAHAGASEMSLHVLHTLDSQEKDRCCQNAERREPCAWSLGRQSVQPLWKTVWSFLKKLKAELPHDPASPSRVCSQRRSQDLRDVSALLCSAALFPVAGCGHNLDVCR